MKKTLILLLLSVILIIPNISAADVFISITDTTGAGIGEILTRELQALRLFTLSDDVFLADFHIAAIITEVKNSRTGLSAGYAAAIIVVPSFVPTFGINLLHSLVTETNSRILCREAAAELGRFFRDLLPENTNYIAENYDAITEYREISGKDVGFLK